MNKISKAQREQLIAIAMGAVMLMAALWYFGVNAKKAELAAAQKLTANKRDQLHEAEKKVGNKDVIDAKLRRCKEELEKREAGLAPDRDTYNWVLTMMNAFIQNRNGVNIATFSQPEFSDLGMIPRFPYRWVTFHLMGTGYYQDLGKFFMDLENEKPYYRIQNPTLTANSGPGMEPEKLTVTFDLVAPVVSRPDTK